jgi:voltage-gated potassium channel
MNSVYQRIKRRTHEILDVGTSGDTVSRFMDIFLMALIMLNVIVVILETVEEQYFLYGQLFRTFDTFSVIIFTVEYVLRIWSCTSDERYSNPLGGRVRFALTPLLVIDLVAILPFYLPMVFPDLRFLRVMRIFRLFRIFKMARYSQSMQTLGRVLSLKKGELTVTFFALIILLVLSSSVIYHVEHEAQPETFSSIPASMWWGVVTLTTVGYGDVYPITPVGKLIGAFIIVIGIGLFALPAGILASGFVEEVQIEQKRAGVVCPHCGKRMDDPTGGPIEQIEKL